MSARTPKAGKAALLKPVAPAPAFTPKEMELAVRFISALRRMDAECEHETTHCVMGMLESMADNHPRHVATRLTLVRGGAK